MRDMKAMNRGGKSMAEAVRNAYREGQTDYYLEPLVRVDDFGNPIGRIHEKDAIIFCCRRGEREIELTEAFTDIEFNHFSRFLRNNPRFVTLILYHEKFKDLPIAFAPSSLPDTLAETISKAGLSQMHCAESEKYAHVTFFLNGGNHQAFEGEVDVCIPSPKGMPFEQVPQLSLVEVAQNVFDGIDTGFDFIITNFANGDVIGHTSSCEAKIKCAEFVDASLEKVVSHAIEKDYAILVTADHGNLEEMLTKEGLPHVAHTANPVPFLLIDPREDAMLTSQDGRLADIAPTILALMDIEKPPIMAGTSLVHKKDSQKPRRVLLVILDGWGIGATDDANPITLAQTPYWDHLVEHYPQAVLHASGCAVGLQEGKAGNSEAGHLNIGAGRLVPQDDVRLDQAMKDGTFQTNEVFLQTMDYVKRQESHLHLLSFLSERSSHGSIEYPLALLRIAKTQGIKEVYLHIIFDGRSTEPGSAPEMLEKLESTIDEMGIGQIVTGIGRGIALDRDGDYAKIQKTYDALVAGIGKALKDNGYDG